MKLLLSLIICLSALPIFGATAILSLKKAEKISAKELRQLKTHPEIKKISPLFTSAEIKILKGIGAEYLSQSWLIELRRAVSLKRLQDVIARKNLPLNLDQNDMEVTTTDFSEEQWGLLNRGNPQGVDLDPMLVYRVSARTGEDIHSSPGVVTGKKIRVAVLDTGLDMDHPDLKSVVVTKPSECAALEKYKACLSDGKTKAEDCEKTWVNTSNPEVDQDKNGYPMDCHGWSTSGTLRAGKILGRPDFEDRIGHGTHVAGIIAAIRGNGIGVDGVSSNVEILPIQVIATSKPSEPLKPLAVDLDPVEPTKPGPSERKNGTLSSLVARGVIYAIHSGAQVLNFSMGWPAGQDSQFMRSVMGEALSRGIVVVAAAGNDSTRALLRPCAYKGVICVGAHGPDGAISHFSNYGSGVDIFAPGLNILSTYPESLRPVRFRKNLGYEFLSGTSQATPFVTGVVAELLSKGIPSSEILARLVLGSRAPQKALPLTEGSPHSVSRVLPEDPLSYKKWGMGGLLDVQRAVAVAAQPMIIPTDKEKIEVPWDRKSAELKFKFTLKNLWQDVATQQVQISADFGRPNSRAIRPRIVSVVAAENYSAVWKDQETREYIATLRIEDTADPSQSRIPGDLEVLVTTQVGSVKRSSYIPLEVTVLIGPETLSNEITAFPIKNMPSGNIEVVPVDQYFDNERSRREYILTEEGEKSQKMLTLQFDGHEFQAVGGYTAMLDGKMDKISLMVGARMDWDTDGNSDYVLGFLEDTRGQTDAKVSPFTFFIFNAQMQVIETFKYDSTFAQMPAVDIFWHRIGRHRMPSWIGMGRDPEKRRSLRDRWENPDNFEAPEVRFYYLDEAKKLKALAKYEEFNFIDILQPTWQQENEGRVPVLLAKNAGTEAKPSYIYEFATAEVIDGKVENFKRIDLFSEEQIYRNMLDTRVGRIISLNPKDEFLRGTFWFGGGRPRRQRLTTLDNQSFELKDYQLGALRAQFDSALFVRGVFSGKDEQYAYVLTNSEIQLHQLNSNRVAQVSLDRYSFFGASVTIDSYYPVTMKSSQSNTMLPGLLVPEGTGLNRGVKLLVPVFASANEIVELVSPARLRFKTDKEVNGCTPTETPVFEGERGTSLDFYCKKTQQILRANLVF